MAKSTPSRNVFQNGDAHLEALNKPVERKRPRRVAMMFLLLMAVLVLAFNNCAPTVERSQLHAQQFND